MTNPKFQLFRSEKDHKFYFRLNAANGETILQSQGYTNKSACENGISSVKNNSTDDNQYERKQSSSGYWFNLKAANGEVIGTSQMYTTQSSRETGISSVKQNGPKSPLEDLTTK
ncbi:YegP family protein [Owenweeksia hongkongensis]|uniref:YegP family protein n=1 Tax=Owenweeksia hongkongensis TaxID=253245 RepID=UPI003A959E04